MAYYECNIGSILESPKLISKAIQPFVNAPRDTKVSALINITSDMINKKCIFLCIFKIYSINSLVEP